MLKQSLITMALLSSVFYSAQAQEKTANNSQAFVAPSSPSSPTSIVSNPNVPLILPTVKSSGSKSQDEVAPTMSSTNESISNVALPSSLPQENVENEDKFKEVKKEEVSEIDKIHEANEKIRSIFSTFAEAINTKNNEKLLSSSREQLIIIPSNQELISSKKTVEEYFPKVIGTNYKFERLELKIEPGFTVELSKSNEMANIYGRGIEKYKFNNVTYSFPIRWTATVIKDEENWKVTSFHSGVNFTENAVLTAFEEFGWKAGVAAGLVGLLLGFVLGIGTIILRKRS